MGGCSFFYLQYSTLVGYVQGKLEETVVIPGDTKTILIFCVKSEIEHISIRFRLYKYWKHWEKYMKNLCVKCCYNHRVIAKSRFYRTFWNFRKSYFAYDGHAVSLWWKSTRGVVADEPHSDSQGLHRKVQARRRDSEIAAWRTEIWYKAHMADKLARDSEVRKATVTHVCKSGR